MRLGFTEILLILAIALLVFGPAVYSWLSRWSRRARAEQAAAARRRAVQEAERRAQRDFILHRFQLVALVLAVLAAAALVYALGFRPIEAEPQRYSVPAAPVQSAPQAVNDTAQTLALDGYEAPGCMRVQDGWLYLAARPAKGGDSVLLRMQPDGGGLSVVLRAAGEITSFAFDAEGSIWYTLLGEGGGALCRAANDGWGAASTQIVTQIDGRPLACPAAVAAGADGRIYFSEAAGLYEPESLDEALRTELLAHTASGWVYVYDPADRTVQRVLGGIAGAAALALSPDGGTLYAADLGSRCVWAVDAAARELCAGGQGCALFAGALPGYPSALAVDGEGAVYIGYRWGKADWLESRSGETARRGVVLRLARGMQDGLFSPGQPAAQRYDAAGLLTADYGGAGLSGAALCQSGNRLYLSGAEGRAVSYLRY